MNNTESWKKYVPETVSLYHVDYRENLDEREDLQEQCIRNNNMGRLYETVMECYAEQEAESLLKILGEIKEKMAEEKRQEEFEEHREEITDLILNRSDTDPAEELIKFRRRQHVLLSRCENRGTYRKRIQSHVLLQGQARPETEERTV